MVLTALEIGGGDASRAGAVVGDRVGREDVGAENDLPSVVDEGDAAVDAKRE